MRCRFTFPFWLRRFNVRRLRRVKSLHSLAFPLVPAPGSTHSTHSTHSASAGAVLFAGFTATMAESDFSSPSRGPCDSPHLHRQGLPPLTLYRSPGALRSRFCSPSAKCSRASRSILSRRLSWLREHKQIDIAATGIVAHARSVQPDLGLRVGSGDAVHQRAVFVIGQVQGRTVDPGFATVRLSAPRSTP